MPYEVTVTEIDPREEGYTQAIYSQRSPFKPDILAIAAIVNKEPAPIIVPKARKKREVKPKAPAPVRPPEQTPFAQTRTAHIVNGIQIGSTESGEGTAPLIAA